ncbi:putative membrane protein [hydrothermal vent metagenome]|uniref:Putative membrane protein n=1 Tax=hydrothermal vent metagenome TaxID=652676 RepID=A0A1W1C694_9ZZZZ
MDFIKILLLLVSSTIISTAHQTGLSYLKLSKIEGGDILVVYKKPLEDSQAKNIEINFPSICKKRKEYDGAVVIENGFIVDKFSLKCTKDTLFDSRIWIDGLVKSDRGVLIEYREGDYRQRNLLRASKPFMYIEKRRSSWEIFVEYIELGFFHILSGYDHLLFLFALLLLASDMRILFYSITAFTISHSLSLVLTVFGVVDVPIPYVESMIALSIIILYREVIEGRGATYGRFQLPLVVLLFGILHGLGFATLLNQIGLPRYDLSTALVAFNIGIELGQILFVSLAYIVMRYLIGMKIVLAYIFGGISTFWFIQRVLIY